MSTSDSDDADDWLSDLDRPARPRKTLAATMGNEMQVAAHELLDRIKSLLEEGRIRRLRVKSPAGELYFEIPVTLGAIGGAALAMAAPFLAMAGGLASLGTKDLRLEIERDSDAAAMMDSGARALAELGTGLAGVAKNLTETVRGRAGRTARSGKVTGSRSAKPGGRARATRTSRPPSTKRSRGQSAGRSGKARTGGAGAGRKTAPRKPRRGKPKGR
jgi:hypothetical protein